MDIEGEDAIEAPRVFEHLRAAALRMFAMISAAQKSSASSVNRRVKMSGILTSMLGEYQQAGLELKGFFRWRGSCINFF